jgi:hypothetical protein
MHTTNTPFATTDMATIGCIGLQAVHRTSLASFAVSGGSMLVGALVASCSLSTNETRKTNARNAMLDTMDPPLQTEALQAAVV